MTFNILINNQLIEVESNISILQACEIANIVVPRFCYHERLSVAGNCRMCLVEVNKMPKLQVSCAVPVLSNMVVKTNTAVVRKAREGILEFLLINHPLDCPVCDQGGECDLQDQSLVYGSDRSRFREFKRAVEDKNCGPLIKTVMSRCIHCTRCVRFANEIMGIPEFGISGRGNCIEIGDYISKLSLSRLSGNLIDLCPVGALTSKPYAFFSRPWELKSTESIDLLDSIHSNIRVDTRGYEIIRVLPRLNELINEEWISDKIRFSFDGFNTQRITVPLKKDSKGVFRVITWNEALCTIHNKFLKVKANSLGFVLGPLCDADSLISIKRMVLNFKAAVISRPQFNSLDSDCANNYRFNTDLKNISKSDVCLLVGIDPSLDGVLLSYHLRKRSLFGNFKIAYACSKIDLSFPAVHLGVSTTSFISILEGRATFCKSLRRAKFPTIIFGKSLLGAINCVNSSCFSDFITHNPNLIRNDWHGLNAFNSASSDFIFSNLYLNYNHKFVNKIFDVLYFVENYEPVDAIISSKYIIFQGHHGCKNAQIADIVIPCNSFFEKTSLNINCEGRYQYTKSCVPATYKSKNSCAILSFYLRHQKGSNKFFYDLLDRCSNLLLDKVWRVLFCNKSLVLNNTYVLPSVFDDFYKTDIVTSSSLNMNKSSLKLLDKTPF